MKRQKSLDNASDYFNQSDVAEPKKEENDLQVALKLAWFSCPIILSFAFYQANLFINTVIFGNMVD